MHNLLKFILKILAKRVITRYQPTVIGITGSVGKTMAKDAVFTVLSRKFLVRKTEKNYNNEFGVPLTVLGIDPFLSTANIRPSNWGRLLRFWPKLAGGFWLAFLPFRMRYPKFLILELASAKPGDIDYLVDMVRPRIGVVTAIGEVPVHVEFYVSPQEVAEEKAKLIAQLPPDGLAILNYDDQTVLNMKERSRAKVVTFGFSNLADIWASDTSYFISDDNINIGGLSFKINSGGTFVPARINNLVGLHQLYGVLAAVAVGLHFGINLVDISGALENIELPTGRMNLLSGIKNSVIIDDTYNASPLSTHAALDALRDFAKAREKLGHKGRRIAVLGDMRELGKYEIEAHRAIGNLAAERCDMLITVGTAGKLIADSAANSAFAKASADKQMPDNIISFNTSEEAKIKVQEIIKEGDVVLVKGSHAMKMELIVEEIKAR
ncbi:MAG: UDP-N-acetylmuramoyl-tripeptide--D-alanyl-D-alanine ligase [Candidatus Yanofskybacteria bacterium]|nr:UDP-N-acetylmuramoyl-tripeptide--D-alanyl-D-alanine ligase [Candidatus Yanofskybacteria bacterium]